jgi:hypothetical protein
MSEFYFTFGQRYKHEPHPRIGALAHPDGWFTIEADSEDKAVARMHQLCGPHWANIYNEDHKPDLKTFPKGELARYKAL